MESCQSNHLGEYCSVLISQGSPASQARVFLRTSCSLLLNYGPSPGGGPFSLVDQLWHSCGVVLLKRLMVQAAGKNLPVCSGF